MPDGKIWMAENLNLTWNGLSIGGQGVSSSISSAHYYNNSDVSYGLKFGLLYNAIAVRELQSNKESLIPNWHIPSEKEFNNLFDSIGGISIAGKKLKANYFPGSLTYTGTDNYGFSMLPSGIFFGTFDGLNSRGTLYTSTEIDGTNKYANFNSNDSVELTKWSNHLEIEYSIRLVKDY